MGWAVWATMVWVRDCGCCFVYAFCFVVENQNWKISNWVIFRLVHFLIQYYAKVSV